MGDLALVQPVIATEILFVFAYLAVRERRPVHARDWLAALGMAVGLGIFLYVANPAGGAESNATSEHWFLSGISVLGAVVVVAAVAMVQLGHRRPSAARQAALLAVAAGIAWGFVAAIVKELSSHLSGGPTPCSPTGPPTSWSWPGRSPCSSTDAFRAGSLAAVQPGLTLVDPLVASLLGITIFGEHLSGDPGRLTAMAVAGALLVGSVILLVRSPIIQTAESTVEVDGAEGDGAAPAPAGPPWAGTARQRRTPPPSWGRPHRWPGARPHPASEHAAGWEPPG